MLTQSRIALISAVADGDSLALAALIAMKPQALGRLNNDVVWLGREEVLDPIVLRNRQDAAGALMSDNEPND